MDNDRFDEAQEGMFDRSVENSTCEKQGQNSVIFYLKKLKLTQVSHFQRNINIEINVFIISVFTQYNHQ